jgi:hypothetical protein
MKAFHNNLQDMGWLMVKQSASSIESRQHRHTTLETAILIELYLASYRCAWHSSVVNSTWQWMVSIYD